MATSPESDVFHHERVRTLIESPRVFLETAGDKFDLIFIPLTDPYRPVASGAYSLNETYDLTSESFAAMISRLNEDGILMREWKSSGVDIKYLNDITAIYNAHGGCIRTNETDDTAMQNYRNYLSIKYGTIE